jgi:hypothetical protein
MLSVASTLAQIKINKKFHQFHGKFVLLTISNLMTQNFSVTVK